RRPASAHWPRSRRGRGSTRSASAPTTPRWNDVIVGMSNGTLREFHYGPGNGSPLHTDPATIAGPAPSAIDAYVDTGGFQHAIVATGAAHGDLHEVWWSPAGSFIFNP